MTQGELFYKISLKAQDVENFSREISTASILYGCGDKDSTKKALKHIKVAKKDLLQSIRELTRLIEEGQE